MRTKRITRENSTTITRRPNKTITRARHKTVARHESRIGSRVMGMAAAGSLAVHRIVQAVRAPLPTREGKKKK